MKKEIKDPDLIRVRHILDAILEAKSFIRDKNKNEVLQDRMIILALIKEIEIMGEAASRLSVKFQKNHTEIDWITLIATRNRLVHGYFDIDKEIVWVTVTRDLPALAKQLQKILKA